MFATNIEQAAYTSLAQPNLMQRPEQGDRRKCCCKALMWKLINCFRSQEQEHTRPRPILVDTHIAQYQAPVVTPSPRAHSVSSADSDQDLERGTLLPKRQLPEPGRNGASTSAAAATTTAAVAVEADSQSPDLPRHRRTGSDTAQIEGVRACILPTGGVPAKGGKWHSAVRQQEFAALAELLGTDADEDDFCPTCLEAYSDDNPKIFTRCGHAFHMQCIYAWLERKNTCPLCESPMDLQDDILL